VPIEYYDKLDSIRKAQIGDIIYSVVGSFGKPVLIKKNKKFAFQRHIAILRPDSSIVDSRYLYYVMLTREFYMQADSVAIGAAQRTISLTSLRNMKVKLPSLDVQQRIATILSRYDSLIENYQKQIKLLEESAQRLYKEWFIDLRFPGHENTKIVDGVPEGSEKKKIKDLVDLKSGYAFKSSAFVEKGKYKIVTIKNVKDGVFDGDNVSYLNSVPEKMPSHCILQTGDILLSLTGNVGRICMVVGDNYLLNQRVAKLESKFPAFTYCLFRHYDTFVAINNLANGAVQQNVSPIRIGEMYMLVANDKIMHHFEKAAENIRTNILNLFSQIRHLTEARDRLLPKLKSGEMEV
jgi:type I restriction enzyme S subunit